MTNGVIHWFRYASPQRFYPLAGRMVPWFATLAALLTAAGLWIAFFVAPTDAQQGQSTASSRPRRRRGCPCPCMS
jgi:heme exporter protein C